MMNVLPLGLYQRPATKKYKDKLVIGQAGPFDLTFLIVFDLAPPYRVKGRD